MNRRLQALIIIVPAFYGLFIGGWFFVIITTPQDPDTKMMAVCYVRGNSDFGANNFIDNDDSTITDITTGLMWSQTDNGEGLTWEDALAWIQQKNNENFFGYNDWWLSTIKELYSLINSDGQTGISAADGIPYLDTNHFDFEYGDTSTGERFIDAQHWSSTEYVSTTMDGNRTVFGVNFADERIMGYPRDTGSLW